MILDPILKFDMSKIKPKKDPLNFPKIKNRYKEHSNKKNLENRPPKCWHSDSKFNFKIFKSKKKLLKKDPLRFKKSKTDIRST